MDSSQQHLVLNNPSSIMLESQITDFQAESSEPQLYLKKTNQSSYKFIISERNTEVHHHHQNENKPRF